MVVHNPSVLHTSIAHVAKPTATNAHSYTQFIIRVSDERSPGLNWTVYRRYSEFRELRIKLEEAIKAGDMCNHCSIMAKRTCFVQFPHRKWFGNLKESTLETRRVGLNSFLDAVAKHARTCKESMTCQTRPLMDQFLMVNDMRYSFLNVNMSDSEIDLYTKFSSGRGDKSSTTPVGAKLSASLSGRLDRLSGIEGLEDVRVSTSSSIGSSVNNQEHEMKDPSEDRNTIASAERPSERISTIEMEGRVLKAKLKTMPNLLSYNKMEKPERKVRTQSWDEDVPARPNSLSDWESVKYQTQSSGRSSDPGAAGGMRNDLLNFSRGGISGGNRPRRSDQRSRARKVHLSSAAKRVKKLEEQEARFHNQEFRRHRKFVLLPTIME
jgi:hypothetical protein